MIRKYHRDVITNEYSMPCLTEKFISTFKANVTIDTKSEHQARKL